MLWIIDRRCFSVFAALLVTLAACAQEPSVQPPSGVSIEEILQPYLGTWRPTSAAEERNIVSLTISTEGISQEIGGSLKYRLERQTDHAVILRVTDTFPKNVTTGALAFSFETVMVGGAPPSPKVARQILWIYWCNRIEQLSGTLDKSSCSKNGYMR